MSTESLPAERFSFNHERHAEDWHEWSTDVSERHSNGVPIEGTRPQRLFVRLQDNMIEIVESDVTSFAPGARELEPSKRHLCLPLTDGLARWLQAALGRALEERARQEGGEP